MELNFQQYKQHTAKPVALQSTVLLSHKGYLQKSLLSGQAGHGWSLSRLLTKKPGVQWLDKSLAVPLRLPQRTVCVIAPLASASASSEDGSSGEADATHGEELVTTPPGTP